VGQPDQRYSDGGVAISDNADHAEEERERVRMGHVVGDGTNTRSEHIGSDSKIRRESQNENQPPRVVGPEVGDKRRSGHGRSFQVEEGAW
jgi:hypothetical protein